MFARLFERWKRSTRFSPRELDVLRALIPSQDMTSSKLLEQAIETPFVSRNLVGDSGFEALIPYVSSDSLLIECDQDLRSPELEILDLRTGRRLRFFTEILRGGFIKGLCGYATDGCGWPKEWNFGSDASQLACVDDSWLDAVPRQVHTSDAIVKLTNWVGIPLDHLSDEQLNFLRFAQPASNRDIQDWEHRVNVKLNEQYKELLRITNGLSIKRGRPYEILGLSDLDFLNMSESWIGVTPLFEDGYVAMKVVDRRATPCCYLLGNEGRVEKIGDVKKHVGDSLAWKV
jgi:hypothetical protein